MPQPLLYRGTRSGFTLLEIMLVIAILILVASFAVPAITGLSSSNNVSTAGRLVANLLTAARSESINSRALIRFEIATTWPDQTDAYRKIILVKHDTYTSSDVLLTNWQTLPNGVVFQDPAAVSGMQAQTPKLNFGKQQITTYYLEFLPTGAMNNSAVTSVSLRLSPGYVSSSGTPPPTSTANWFDVRVDGLVGRVAIVRP